MSIPGSPDLLPSIRALQQHSHRVEAGNACFRPPKRQSVFINHERVRCVVDVETTIGAGDNRRQTLDFRVKLRQVFKNALVLKGVLCCFEARRSVCGDLVLYDYCGDQPELIFADFCAQWLFQNDRKDRLKQNWSA